MSARNQHPTASVVGKGASYKNVLDLVDDRNRIDALAEAMNISPRNVGKDSCSKWSIIGSGGAVIQTYCAKTFLLYVVASSTRKWKAIKRKALAAGWQVSQDGDDEGCLRFALPNPHQAALARQLLGLRRRKTTRLKTGHKTGGLRT